MTIGVKFKVKSKEVKCFNALLQKESDLIVCFRIHISFTPLVE